MSPRRPSGFTLIELMIAVAIVGILASVALPSFRILQLRSKAAERMFMMQAVYRSIDDLWLRDGRFPIDLDPSTTFLDLTADQPDAVASTTRKPWRLTPASPTDHWNRLAIVVEGSLYYRYGGAAITSGARRAYQVYAYGDLDGDGVVNRWTKTWEWVSGTKQRSAGSTLHCADCSLALEEHPETF